MDVFFLLTLSKRPDSGLKFYRRGWGYPLARYASSDYLGIKKLTIFGRRFQQTYSKLPSELKRAEVDSKSAHLL